VLRSPILIVAAVEVLWLDCQEFGSKFFFLLLRDGRLEGGIVTPFPLLASHFVLELCLDGFDQFFVSGH
jgi:hypothetical protein